MCILKFHPNFSSPYLKHVTHDASPIRYRIFVPHESEMQTDWLISKTNSHRSHPALRDLPRAQFPGNSNHDSKILFALNLLTATKLKIIGSPVTFIQILGPTDCHSDHRVSATGPSGNAHRLQPVDFELWRPPSSVVSTHTEKVRDAIQTLRLRIFTSLCVHVLRTVGIPLS